MPPALTAIVVSLRADVARAVYAGTQDSPSTVELNAALKRFGVALTPQHPDSGDAELQSYFIIPGVPLEQAELIANTLREFEAVQAAYIQPPMSPA